MFKAKKDIGNFKADDIVPDSIAKTWQTMYTEDPTYFIADPVIAKPDDLDLNKDGKIDKDDAKIASKVLNKVNKHKGRK